MSSSNFLFSPQTSLVADASVVINLNATGCAAEIIKATSGPFLVTDNACAELEYGVGNGHRDYGMLIALIEAGLVRRAALGTAAIPIYEPLIDGTARQTLDDGEAATIACAHEIGGVALIDESKARRLCATSFPNLAIASTAELLTHPAMGAALGAPKQINALTLALTRARMRVPPEHLAQVTAMLGTERAALCASLPKAARRA